MARYGFIAFINAPLSAVAPPENLPRRDPQALVSPTRTLFSTSPSECQGLRQVTLTGFHKLLFWRI
jgi:hypothetical protein